MLTNFQALFLAVVVFAGWICWVEERRNRR